jgi:hypothetical protein
MHIFNQGTVVVVVIISPSTLTNPIFQQYIRIKRHRDQIAMVLLNNLDYTHIY